MARTTVTEESLGLAPTEEEMAPPPVIDADDEISIDDDPPPEAEKAAEQAKKPEEAAKPKDEGKKPEDEPKTVDLRALQEARAEAREAKRQAAVLEQRWNDFLSGQGQQKQPAKEEPEVPRWDTDPLKAGQWTQEQLIALQQAQAEERQRAQEERQAETQYQQAFLQVNSDFETASKTDPTVAEAYNALLKSQGDELLAMGYSILDAQKVLRDVERQHVQFVASRGLDIGQYVKALAAARGWTPQQAAAASAAQAQAKSQTDLAAVAEAQKRHQSLSDAPGGEAPPVLDAKALARMSDKDFKAWMSQRGNEEKFDQIMGKG